MIDITSTCGTVALIFQHYPYIECIEVYKCFSAGIYVLLKMTLYVACQGLYMDRNSLSQWDSNIFVAELQFLKLHYWENIHFLEFITPLQVTVIWMQIYSTDVFFIWKDFGFYYAKPHQVTLFNIKWGLAMKQTQWDSFFILWISGEHACIFFITLRIW